MNSAFGKFGNKVLSIGLTEFDVAFFALHTEGQFDLPAVGDLFDGSFEPRRLERFLRSCLVLPHGVTAALCEEPSFITATRDNVIHLRMSRWEGKHGINQSLEVEIPFDDIEGLLHAAIDLLSQAKKEKE